LAEPPSFTEWLEGEVEREQQDETIQNPANDVIRLASPPSPRATKFRSMWAFRNHLRVASVEANLKTCDSGVAATFSRPCIAGVRDRNPIVANIEYVGNLEEILELNYGGLMVTVLACR
jgi:hypothetical protein